MPVWYKSVFIFYLQQTFFYMNYCLKKHFSDCDCYSGRYFEFQIFRFTDFGMHALLYLRK
jgi:hypothetical protein